MPLAFSHGKAPLKTYGSSRRTRFTVFQDPVSPTTKFTEKTQGIARKDTDVTPETSCGLRRNLGTGHLPPGSQNLAKRDADSSDELAQTSRFLKISSHSLPPAEANDMCIKSKRTNARSELLPKLQDKSTNMIVKSTLTRTPLLETPITRAIRPQLPKTPPKKRPQSAIPPKHSPSPLSHRGKHSVVRVEQTPKPNDFPNILSSLKPKQTTKRLSAAKGNRTGADSASVYGLSRYCGVAEYKPGKDSMIATAEDTNKVIKFTTQPTGRLYPILVQPKFYQDMGLEANPQCATNQGIKKDTKTKGRVFKEVADKIDSEDLCEGNTIRTRRKSHVYAIQESGEREENSSNSESNGDSGGDLHNNIETSNDEMISDHLDEDRSHEGLKFKNFRTSLRKHIYITNRIAHDDDSEQAFDGDVEMLTGDDNSDSDEVATTSRVSVVSNLTHPRDEDTHVSNSYEGRILFSKQSILGTNITNDIKDTNDTLATSPQNDDDNDNDGMMDLESKTKKRGPANSPKRPGAKRHLSIHSRTISRSKDARKIPSLLHSPPEDPSKLSEDELCSTKYMITPVSIKNRNKTPQKSGNKKRIATPRGKGQGHKPATDLMDID